MTVSEMITELSHYPKSKLIIIRLGDSLNVSEIPVGGFDEVSYCESWQDIVTGDDYQYVVNEEAERKKCAKCRMARESLCERKDGIGQYMVHALLVGGGKKREGVPSFEKEYAAAMTAKGLSYVSGMPLKRKP